jgi:hypothetical protein
MYAHTDPCTGTRICIFFYSTNTRVHGSVYHTVLYVVFVQYGTTYDTVYTVQGKMTLQRMIRLPLRDTVVMITQIYFT